MPHGDPTPAQPAITEGPLEDLLARRPELRQLGHDIRAAFRLLADSFAAGGKLLVCGNGGSAADAAHIVGELMKAMSRPRPLPKAEADALRRLGSPELTSYLSAHLEGALPSIDLCSQQALLCAIGNDTAGDVGFAQQVVGYGAPGDVLWGLSTSGRSRNVLLAALTAKARGLRVLAFTGPQPSDLRELADVAICVPATTVPTIQELHLPIYHTLCQLLEERFFS